MKSRGVETPTSQCVCVCHALPSSLKTKKRPWHFCENKLLRPSSPIKTPFSLSPLPVIRQVAGRQAGTAAGWRPQLPLNSGARIIFIPIIVQTCNHGLCKNVFLPLHIVLEVLLQLPRTHVVMKPGSRTTTDDE